MIEGRPHRGTLVLLSTLDHHLRNMKGVDLAAKITTCLLRQDTQGTI